MTDLIIRDIPESLFLAIEEYASRKDRTPEEEILDLIKANFATAESGKSFVEAIKEFGRIAQFTKEELKLFERDKTPHKGLDLS